MRHPRNQIAITAVAFVLGLLVVGQLHAQNAAPTLAGLSAQDLTTLITNVSSHNDSLRAEVAALEAQLSELEAGQARGDSAVDALREDLSRTQTWAGVVAVAGPGVTVTVSGPISAGAVHELLNELRNGGAEAMAIGGTRVVAATSITGEPNQLAIDGRPLGTTFDIFAIGSPQSLTGTLTRIGGVVAQIGATEPSVSLTVTPTERIEAPATNRILVPAHGRPSL
jgi:uncharacterized protein YlxW (UPF0749 family)